MQDEEKGINSTYARLREQEKSLEARIADETRKLNEDNRERREALDNTRRKLEDERQTLEAQKADKNNEYRTAEQELRTLNQGLSAAVDEQKRQRNKVAELDTLIARLNSTRSNRIMAFGQSIPQLLQAINNETRWKKKPVGPLGLHLELKDQKWAPVLESVIGTTLDAFSVTNHDDRRLLTELMRRTRW